MQALGRCIRHRGDFGAIILLDERLRSRNIQGNLSRWLRDQVCEPNNTQVACKMLSGFYATQQHKPDIKDEIKDDKLAMQDLKQDIKRELGHEVKEDVKSDIKPDDVKLEDKLRVKSEEEGAHAADNQPPTDEASARKRWADNSKRKQLKISEVFVRSPYIKLEENLDDFGQEEGTTNAPRTAEANMNTFEHATTPTQPNVEGSVHQEGIPGAGRVGGIPPVPRLTQPNESLAQCARGLPRACKPALQLIEATALQRRTPVETEHGGKDENCGNSLHNSQEDADQTTARDAPTEGHLCMPSTIKRPRGDSGCTGSRGAAGLLCTPQEQSGSGVLRGMTAKSTADNGAILQMDPVDIEFLESGLADFLADESDDDGVISGDRRMLHTVDSAQCNARQCMPTQLCAVLQHVPVGHGHDQAWEHALIAGHGAETALEREGRTSTCHAQAGAQDHTRQWCSSQPVAAQHQQRGELQPRCMDSEMPHRQIIAHAEDHQYWQLVWDSACAQWYSVDCSAPGEAVRTADQHSAHAHASDVSSSQVAHPALHNVLHALYVAERMHEQGQLQQYLGQCTIIPCGLAVVLKYAQMEGGMLTCESSDLLDRSMHAWVPFEHATSASEMLSHWSVGYAITRLRNSYETML